MEFLLKVADEKGIFAPQQILWAYAILSKLETIKFWNRQCPLFLPQINHKIKGDEAETVSL